MRSSIRSLNVGRAEAGALLFESDKIAKNKMRNCRLMRGAARQSADKSVYLCKLRASCPQQQLKHLHAQYLLHDLGVIVFCTQAAAWRIFSVLKFTLLTGL